MRSRASAQSASRRFLVIRKAVNRGAEPLEVFPGGSWLIVAGDQDEDGVLNMERDEGSSKSKGERFFTKDDELFRSGGRTYAVAKMWGDQTLTVVDRIVRQYDMDDVSYEAIE